MIKSIAAKMFVQPGMRALLQEVPSDVLEDLGLPDLDLPEEIAGEFDHLHVFVTSRAQLERQMSALKPRLAPDGQMWISWPKAKKLGTDLNLHEVIEVGYRIGLVESKCISIDSVWSALRFTWPKPGVHYNNSHAVLNREM